MTPRGCPEEGRRDRIVMKGGGLRRAGARSRLRQVKLDKQELVRLLRTEGDNDTADKVEAQLPDEIDTDSDSAALESVGLDRTELMNKLAAGGFGTTLSP
jgi:hypothetical protein